MRQYTRLFYIYIPILILCCACRDLRKSNPLPTTEKRTISLEEFEEITENNPSEYINNPDSFLNSLHLSPKDEYENAVYGYGLILMAYNLREQGNIFKAIQYYEKALNFVKEKNVDDLDISVYILKPLAALYINVDDNKKAITLLEDVLSKINRADYIENLGFVNNLANAYIYNDEADKAVELITNNIKNLKPSIDKALLFNTLSKAYEVRNDRHNSGKYNQLAVDEFQQFELNNDTLIWYCAALTQYAELYHSANEVLKTIEILNTNFPKTQYRNKANAYLTLASIHFDKKEFTSARANYQKAFENFQQGSRKYILDYKYTYSLLGLARSLHAENQIDSALSYYEWAIENDFRTQQLITSEADQLRNNIWNKNILEELIELYVKNLKIQSQKSRETLLWCIELSKARLLINEINRSENWSAASDQVKTTVNQIRQLYQKLDASESAVERKAISDQITKLKTEFQLTESYFETINFNPSKKDFLAKIQHNQNAYYSYYIHQDNALSIVYKSDNDLYYKKLIDSSLIDSLTQFKSTYFSNSPNAFNNNPEQYIKSAKYFCSQLLPQLNTNQKDVFLSLDGNLYGLPFDALYKEDFLIKKHNFAYLNSFLLFEFITNQKQTTTKEISLLYRSEFPKPLPHLEFVNQEVENLTNKFKTFAIPPERQNDSTIRDAFSRTNIIHIAAHTILDSVEAPYLYLHQAISTNQLRFFDIKTPLVFLSACNTGSGLALPSEGTESIQRVFMSKNVPSVISTYWFANDEVMLTLTSNFYDQLQKTENPIVALADAKRNYLQQASAHQQNPWYWANINYTGVGNKVGLKKSSNLPNVIMGLTIFSVIGFLAFKRLSRSNKVSI